MTRYGNEETRFSLQFKNTDAIEGSLSLRTPIPCLRNIDAKFTHSGDLDQFTSSVDFQQETIGKMEGSLTFFRQNWRRINSNLVIKTPFVGFEQTKMSIKHTANMNSIKSFADISYGDDKHIRASMKGSLEPMEIDLLFASPFDGVENLHASAKSSSSGDKHNAEIVLSSQNKTISLSTLLDLDSRKKSAEIILNTPFSGIESSKFAVVFNGSPLDFTSSIDMQSFLGNLKSDGSFQYTSPSDFASSISLTSDVRGFESMEFGVKNAKKDNEVQNQLNVSWNKERIIESLIKYSSFESWGTSTRRGSLSINTPFELLRRLNIQGNSEQTSSSVKQSVLAEMNDRKVLDMDVAFAKDSKQSASLVMREPQPLELKGETLWSDSIKSALVSINLDTSSTERQATFEIKYVTDSYNQKKQTVAKITTPSRSVEVRGSGEMSSSRLFSSWDALINDIQVFGFDAELSRAERRNNYEKSTILKLRFPERSIAMSGSYQDGYGKKSVDGSIMWDADRDVTKKFGVSASLLPQGDSLKADVSLEIPSIGKVIL